jgi:hypothetical protein
MPPTRSRRSASFATWSRAASIARQAEIKLLHYRRSLEILERELPGSPLVELLRFELESFDALPPTRAG